jgi:hypothetical protein
MRMLMIITFLLSMVSPAFAGILHERERGNGSPWFQDCEQEVARPFCGTLKMDPAVEAMARQMEKHVSLIPKSAEPPRGSATATQLDRQNDLKMVPEGGTAGREAK